MRGHHQFTVVEPAANSSPTAPKSTDYFTDVDAERLRGDCRYAVTFADGQIPPVRGLWSLTLYDRHHFFAAQRPWSARRTRTSTRTTTAP